MKRLPQKIIALVLVCVLLTAAATGLLMLEYTQLQLQSEAQVRLENQMQLCSAAVKSRMLRYEGLAGGLASFMKTSYDVSKISDKSYNDSMMNVMGQQACTMSAEEENAVSVFGYCNPHAQGAVSGYHVTNGIADTEIPEDSYASYLNGTWRDSVFLDRAWSSADAFWTAPYLDNEGTEILTYCVPVWKGESWIGVVGLDVCFSEFAEIAAGAATDRSVRVQLLDTEKTKLLKSSKDRTTERTISEKLSDGMTLVLTGTGSAWENYAVSVNPHRFWLCIGLILFAVIFAVWIGRKIAAPCQKLSRDLDKLENNVFQERTYLQQAAEQFHQLSGQQEERVIGISDATLQLSTDLRKSLEMTETLCALAEEMRCFAAKAEKVKTEKTTALREISEQTEEFRHQSEQLAEENEKRLAEAQEILQYAVQPVLKFAEAVETKTAGDVEGRVLLNSEDALRIRHLCTTITELQEFIRTQAQVSRCRLQTVCSQYTTDTNRMRLLMEQLMEQTVSLPETVDQVAEKSKALGNAILSEAKGLYAISKEASAAAENVRELQQHAEKLFLSVNRLTEMPDGLQPDGEQPEEEIEKK